MDQDKIKGSGAQIAGSIKEAIGKVTGDTKVQAEGAAQKQTGKAQTAAGDAKDSVRDKIKE